MITKLTPREELNIQLSAVWFEPAKRGAIIRKLNKLDKAVKRTA
jgi:hypothetical protein